MTGFGLGEQPLGQGRLVFEIRSLNHRYLDVRIRLPEELTAHTSFLEQLARERLSRGRYDIGVRLFGAALPPPRLIVERARAAYQELCTLRDELAPNTELPLTVLTGIPGLFASQNASEADHVIGVLRAAFDASLHELDQMRSREGERLALELNRLLDGIDALTENCSKRVPVTVDLHRTRLQERLTRLLADRTVVLDSERIEQEIALLAERSDVTEELTRLASHFAQFRNLLSDTAPVGRRLDFLLQEIAREINTLGAKSQDAELSRLVVTMKAEVEKMREQVQNVE